MDIIHAHIDFACRLIRKIGVDNSLVKTKFTSIGGNAEHIVHGWVNRTCMDSGGSFGKLLYHRLLDFCRLCHLVVIDRRWSRQIELVGGFNIRRFFEQVHQFR